MYIKKIRLKNFKRFSDWFELNLSPNVNILVGENEIGKSTIIEAINLALSGFYQGKYVRNDINQYLFNRNEVDEYLLSIKEGTPLPPPSVEIEVFFDDWPAMKGNHNSQTVEACGLYYKICFDESYQSEYNTLLELHDITTLPVEYYHVVWRSFHREDITARSIPYKALFIDTSTQYQTASDMYVSHIIKNKLDEKDRINITQSYRKAQQTFLKDDAIVGINSKLADMAQIDSEDILLSVDLSSKRAWEDSLTAYMHEIPFHFLGKGEQCIIKTKLALARKSNGPEGIILLEEPENHLSFGKLNELVSTISSRIDGKQLLVSTHSSFVLNKLGLSSLILLSDYTSCRLTDLSSETISYFEKLAGYDTLRMLLCKRTIMVEGDSDELVIQRAYKDKYGRLPIEDGVDVLCVKGLSFLKFLEIARTLKLIVAVATDNDGDIDAVIKKYDNFLGDKSVPNIKICFDETIDTKESFGCDDETDPLPDSFNYNTLEPKMLKANGLDTFIQVFGEKYDTTTKMLRHLHSQKSESALSLLKTPVKISYPQYILDAISHDGN